VKQTLKQSHLHPARLLVGACTLLMILSVAPAGFAQQANQAQAQPKPQVASAPSASAAASPAASSPAAKPAEEEKETATPKKPGHEGIKIHGHWVLEVKNPDGKVVDRREFNNSLVTGGSSNSGNQILAALLTGYSAGGMAIAFIQGTTTGLDPSTFCNGAGGGAIPSAPAGITCFALVGANFQSDFQSPQGGLPNQETGLSNVVNFSPNVSIVLSGNYTVMASDNLTSISAVQTLASLCLDTAPAPTPDVLTGTVTGVEANLIGPNACGTDPSAVILASPNYVGTRLYSGALTSTNVQPNPLTVTTGQVVSVTVTLSFS